MKKSSLIIFSLSVILFSCKTAQFNSFVDDVYVDPVEEKKLELARTEALKKKQAEEKAAEDAVKLAQKAKDDANPYYQDPHYTSDDYYDYAYSSRMRRFQNPMDGVGYYDNYYTNSYWYNQNPGNYGSSIYNSYNWWNSPSSANYMGNTGCQNMGLGYGSGYNYGSNYYNPYNSFYSYNQPYNYGYNQPWNMYNNYNNYSSGYQNGYGNYSGNSNWGYFNSYDQNSNYTYAPRQGYSGGNSKRGSYAGMAVPTEYSNDRLMFINSVVEKQESTPKFSNYGKRYTSTNSGNPAIEGTNYSSGKTVNETAPNTSTGSNNTYTGRNSASQTNTPYTTESNTSTNSNPRKNQSSGTRTPVSSTNNEENTNTFFNRTSNGNSSGSGGTGSSSAPRGGGSGGTVKPR